MRKTIERMGFIAGAGVTTSIILGAGTIVREINIKKEKSMLLKLTSVQNKIDIIKDYVNKFVVRETIDTEYIMESESYKKLLDDGYLAKKISYYIMGAEIYFDLSRKDTKREVERMYKYYVDENKISKLMGYFKEKVKSEIEEMKKKETEKEEQ